MSDYTQQASRTNPGSSTAPRTVTVLGTFSLASGMAYLNKPSSFKFLEVDTTGKSPFFLALLWLLNYFCTVHGCFWAFVFSCREAALFNHHQLLFLSPAFACLLGQLNSYTSASHWSCLRVYHHIFPICGTSQVFWFIKNTFQISSVFYNKTYSD